VAEVKALAGLKIFTPPAVTEDGRGEMWAWFDAARGGLDYWHMHEGTVARSNPGVVRGIHYAPGRAKYITCLYGSVYDVAVDLRQGSPTFGDHMATTLDPQNRKAVYIPAGLGHGYMSLEHSIVVYLYDTPYDPEHYYAINPLDKRLGIQWPWPDASLIMSSKDTAAPGLDKAAWLPG
jgi:dTDP-4-dehydrorhamnose 3,5-epimerase